MKEEIEKMEMDFSTEIYDKDIIMNNNDIKKTKKTNVNFKI
jgi:hypothetical protein